MERRKEMEIMFHNKREKDHKDLDYETFQSKYSNKKYYSITRKSKLYINQWLLQNSPGKVALDYCCGLGQNSIEMASLGALVYGIDISEESINTASYEAEKFGLGYRTKFSIMDAENLKFEDKMFDVILCSGVLHHLDLNKAFSELARVLKPSGSIICIEALGYNPIINLYRKKTPHLRTEWETEHILTLREVRKAKKYFNKVDIKFFYLASILAVPFRKTLFFNSVLLFFELIDSIVLRIPLIQLMAWQMVFILSESKI